MSTRRWLVTGANRGIGFGITTSLLVKGHQVIAVCRSPETATNLQKLVEQYKNSIKIQQCAITDEQSVINLAKRLSAENVKLNGLINNAGILDRTRDGDHIKITDFDPNVIREAIEVNLLGAMQVTKHLIPFLESKSPHPPVIVNMSSEMGSIGNTSSGYYGYRISKTSLNMFNKVLSNERPDICCVVTCPGWVKTDMGGPDALITLDESCSKMVQLFEGLTLKDTSKFLKYTGNQVPW